MEGRIRAVNGRVLCPQCKVATLYTSETERKNSSYTRIIRYYKCPACWGRIIDEEVIVTSNGSLIEVRVKIYNEKFIPGARRRQPSKILERIERLKKLASAKES